SASASSARSRCTRRRSTRSTSPRSATSTARSSTTCAARSARRLASASCARARTRAGEIGGPAKPRRLLTASTSDASSSSLRQLCDGSPAAAVHGAIVGAVAPKRTGRKLLAFDRKLGARFVAGADEAGRGPLAGPLVVAGVLLDYGCLRDHKVRPLAQLNDSKQCSPERREALFHAVMGCAEQVVVRVIPHGQI